MHFDDEFAKNFVFDNYPKFYDILTQIFQITMQ